MKKKVSSGTVGVPGKGEIAIPNKFPTVEETLIKLLTDQYPLFVQDILWVAPRPTTFKVMLKNGQYFIMTKTENDWIVQVEGKKYYMPSIQDEQRATDALARVLSYGQLKSAGSNPPAEEQGGAGLPAPEETPAEEPTEETPSA